MKIDLRRMNVRVVASALQGAAPFRPFPNLEDGPGLAALAGRIGPDALAALRARAEIDRDAPVPALPAALYLDFLRTGRREPYEDALRDRRQMLYRLTLAELFTPEGGFADAAANLLWARLEETNWAWPAHAHHGMDRPDHPTLDLSAAMSALDLAEIDYLLADRLPPALRARIRSEIRRRAIDPFLERHDHWWLHTTPERKVNNWTAVCVAGVVGAACYLEEDPDRLAAIVARGLASLADYLETFDADGGSTEGPDYWSYGFGNFVVIAHLLAERSGGKIDLFADPYVRRIARFPLHTMLAPGLWASFSDSDVNPQFHPGLLSCLADRLDLPELAGLGTRNDFTVEGFNQFAWPLRQYAWPLPEAVEAFTGTAHDWYPDMAWMVSRLDPADPASLRLAVKGGHNDEMHNQNDVGALIVVAGGRALVVDPGRGRYNKAYFGPNRYDSIMTSSRGHSVPVVDGHAQTAGLEYGARVLDHAAGAEGDRLVLDMAAAYPEAEAMVELRRAVRFDRRAEAGEIEVVDAFAFRDAPRDFESVLVTAAQAELLEGRIVISDAGSALEVVFDPALVAARLEHHPGVEKQYAPSVDLTLILFAPAAPQKAGEVRLVLRPVTQENAKIA